MTALPNTQTPTSTKTGSRIYLYARVSTNDQTTAQQFAAMEDYLFEQRRKITTPEGITVIKLEDVGVSGAVPFGKRPKGHKVLESIKAGDHLICAKLDRAFRSVSDCLATAEELKRRGVHLHLLNLRVGEDACINNGLGKFFMVVLAATAELEKSFIAERTREQKQTRKSQGLYIGGKLPWFQTKDTEGRVHDIPERVKAVEQMRALRSAGVALSEIRKRVAKKKFSISVTTIRALTQGHASEEARTRGRRLGFRLKRKAGGT